MNSGCAAGGKDGHVCVPGNIFFLFCWWIFLTLWVTQLEIIKSKFDSCLNGEPLPPHSNALGNRVTSSYPLILVNACSALLSEQRALLPGPGLQAQRVG